MTTGLTAALCFDRLEFRQKDFSAENFLVKARRRGNSFERIRDDLRVLLKIVQNSMIELINKDYADFVNLSSNLAGLRGVVDKLNNDVGELVQDFNQVSAKIRESVDMLNEKYKERHFIKLEKQSVHFRAAQFHKMNRLKPVLNALKADDPVSCYSKLDRLNHLISDFIAASTNSVNQSNSSVKSGDQVIDCVCDSEQLLKDFNACVAVYQSVLEKLFIEEVRKSGAADIKPAGLVNSETKQNVAKILASFACCDRLEAAHACFLNEFIVGEEFKKVFKSKKPSESQQVVELQTLLNLLVTIRSRYAPLFEHFERKTFICDCLLTCLFNYLDERFTNLLFSTDASAFRQSYKILCKFFADWTAITNEEESPSKFKPETSCNLIRLIFSKFNVHVYYQLRKKELMDSVSETFDSRTIIIPRFQNFEQNDGFHFKASALLYHCIETIWRNDENEIYSAAKSNKPSGYNKTTAIVLPPLISRCAELTLQLLNRYQRLLTERNCSMLDVDRFRPSERNSISTVTTDHADASQFSSNQPVTFNENGADEFLTPVYIVGDLIFLKQKIVLIDFSWDTTGSVKRFMNDSVQKICYTVESMLLKMFADSAIAKMQGRLSAVSEIPRRYRWTRKDAPDQPSAYVRNGFDVIQAFLDAAFKCSLPNDGVERVLSMIFPAVIKTFENEVRNVVNSVDKISSSLTKLKKSGKSSGVGGSSFSNDLQQTGLSAMTDDEKIRLQLRLDVQEFVHLLNGVRKPFLITDSASDSICAAYDTNLLENLVQFSKSGADSVP